MNHSQNPPRFLAVLLAGILAMALPARAIVDLNGNGIDDIWELEYGNGYNPNGTDGSGLTYLQESIAGLAPGNAKSYFRAAISASGTSAALKWPSVAGKVYQMEARQSLTTGSWTAIGSAMAGTGLMMSSTIGGLSPAYFYKVEVSDTNSSGDQLTEWEALQLGLNPNNPYSNGTVNGSGQPVSDYQYVVAALTATNVVSITVTKPGATVPNANPASDTATIMITRSGNLNSITIPLRVSGVAIPGSDYQALPASITLPVGKNSATISVVPLAASHLLSGETVTLALGSSQQYLIGSSGTATAVIYPSQAANGTGLTGYYYASSSTTYSGTANFNPSTLKITRTDPGVNFFWGSGQPYTAVNRNNFSATWLGQIKAPKTGNYIFAIQADAGARMYINGQLAINAWTANSATAAPMQSGTIPLVSGSSYQAEVDYWENTDPASIYLTWEEPASTSFAGLPTADVLRPGTSGSTGWNATYYNDTTLSGSAAYTTVEHSLYWDWGTGSPDPSIPTTHYSARWLGQVQPQYSEPYTFVTHTDDGAMLYVNGLLITSDWVDQSASDIASATINLQAGVRYNIQMDYYKDKLGSGQAYLSWYSPSQPQEIIPQNMLYPSTVPPAPPAITSTTAAVALVGGSFNYVISASNGGGGFAVSGLPPGLTFNPATGAISGVPAQPGIYTIVITATNGTGSGSSTLTIDSIQTGGGITRELWTNVSGTSVSDIPLTTAPNLTGTLTSLEAPSNTGTNYGQELVGYLTAPVTGNYYFWLAGSTSAELWISDDSDPVNNLKRAAVLNPTGPEQWYAEPGQQSPWLSLTAGQNYYIVVLQKNGTASGDNLSVGWLRPDETGTTVSEVVPGYALSPYTPPANTAPAGTLYGATLLASPSVSSDGVGSATLVLSPNQTTATLAFNYSNLSSTVTDTQLMSEPHQNNPSQVIYDITKFAKQNPDGSYTFTIGSVGSLTAAEVLEIIQDGQSFLVVGTANHPSGEIQGNFTLSSGAQSFTPPPAPPTWTDDHNTDAGASRFLTQATFGPSPSEITRVESMGYSAWIDDQFTRPSTHQMAYVLANPSPSLEPVYPDTLTFNSWWLNSITAPDQLRQRVAFALSEIMVISDVGALNNNALLLTSYYDTLLDNAFGNYFDLLKAVTLTPSMGNYLNMRDNAKANYAAGLHPDENYAREVNQLFSIGLYRLWPDGSLVENSTGDLVPTYQQATVQGFAAVFTGWNYHQALQGNGRLPTNWSPPADDTDPMTLVPTFHDLGSKLTLDNVVLPPAIGEQADSSNVAFDQYCSGDLDSALGIIFNHPNVGPFICRELIQRLVTSSPSRGYVYRVAQVFDDDGTGVRGNLQAVIKAILLDYEARSPDAASQPGYGKEKEPLLRVTGPARYFAPAYSLSGTYSQTGGQTILISSTSANRMTNGDHIVLNFISGTPLPYSGSYSVSNVTNNTFTVNAAGLLSGTYTQSGQTVALGISNSLSVGDKIYLAFPAAAGLSGTYSVASVADTSHFSVTAASSGTGVGTVLMEKFGGGYVVTTSSTGNINTIDTSVNHGLNPGDPVWIDFSSGSAVSGSYTVLTVPDLTHFTISAGSAVAQTQNKLAIYPLAPPPLVRSGTVSASTSTWNIGMTDTSLTQSPLNSPTVFNYYYPDYRYPGALASAGLTTPEFQLTNATNVMLQTNFLEGGILGDNNINGLTSFVNGNGTIELDLGPYLNMTANASIPSLVDLLNAQLMGGSMSPGMRSAIISYVANTTNFPYSSPPTVTQQSNRARAVVHLIITSPEFTIQQ